MVISLTMPSFRKLDGLATALYSLLNTAGVETHLIYIRGSSNRLKALRNGHCYTAVMSTFAAEELCGKKERVILHFPPKVISPTIVFTAKQTQHASLNRLVLE